MDLLIDSVTRSVVSSFMDGFSGYNQIRMAPRDAEKTAFKTPIGNFYYTVMPFRLKNTGETYQRAMMVIFHDMMHQELEDCVDDIVVKSRKREEHFHVLRKAPVHKKPLLLYLATNSYAIGALIAQEDGGGIVQPVYYISRALKNAETRYRRAERACLAIMYASQRLRYYLLTYKWAEAVPLCKAIGEAVPNFIKENIIVRFKVPHKIISDNGTPFFNSDVRKMLEFYQVKQHRSSPYYPQGNGQAEVTNKTLIKIISRMSQEHTGGWEKEKENEVFAAERCEDLERLDERREEAQERNRRYRQRMTKAYDRMTKERVFMEGQFMLKVADYVR
ncbi:uncharacterized protein LOC111993327 [Quercus suber]|uniref:uncharacterized protein LOC111993327 n=1 Tax=Quercus suber TaxID=58331 RepID=UPI000CE1EF69|nr:uncharacterized protein LOC111993327 [Quercus suber]